MTELANEFMHFWIADGILYSKFTHKTTFDLDVIKKLIEMRHTISDNVNQYWCYDVRDANSFPKECRDYADKYGQDYLFACALIINSHIQKFLFNAYLKLKKSQIPLQAFTNRDKAVAWLNELKLQNKQCVTI